MKNIFKTTIKSGENHKISRLNKKYEELYKIKDPDKFLTNFVFFLLYIKIYIGLVLENLPDKKFN